MSVRLLEDLNEDKVALYDSVTGIAFGPVIDGPLARNRAERFLDTLVRDARLYSTIELEKIYVKFRAAEESSDEDLVARVREWST